MDLINIGVGTAGVTALLGYLVVFFGLILLMIVIMIEGKVFINKAAKASAIPAKAVVAEASAVKAEPAPGSAGDLKLYTTDPKDAAMIMAIVANKLGKPVNELRFKSIKEVK